MQRVRISLDTLLNIEHRWLNETPREKRGPYADGISRWLRSKDIELEIIQSNIFLLSTEPEKITQLLLEN